MKDIELHPLADREAEEAMDYIDEHRPGWGRKFISELRHVFKLIRRSPETWHFVSDSRRVRRCNFNIFPYTVIFAETKNSIYVVAVMYQGKDPDYWKNRETDIPE